MGVSGQWVSMVMMELGLHMTSQCIFQWFQYSLLKDVVDWHVIIIFTPPCALGYME
jgi:hypothetical protein